MSSSTHYDVTVFIGRFEPLHRAHLDTIRFALGISKRLILVLGSHRAAPSFSCPWSAPEREEMIRLALTPQESARVTCIYVRDKLFDLERWQSNVYQEVYHHVSNPQASIALVGHFKDASSSYLSLFKRWSFVSAPVVDGLNATDFRRWFFLNKGEFSPGDIPTPLFKWLEDYKKTTQYTNIVHEATHTPTKAHYHQFVYEYVLFRCHNYVLLERRWGRDLFALPGETTLECPTSAGMPSDLSHLPEPLFHFEQEYIWQQKLGLNISTAELAQCTTSTQIFYDAIAQKRSRVIQILANKLDICPKINNVNNHIWLLKDDIPLMQEKIYGDHFHILCQIEL